MNDQEIPSDLQATESHLSHLGRQVAIDGHHKARLGEELMRRHQELSAESTRRAAGKLWPRFAGLKRLTLVAPPALAAATALSVFLWALQISGHQTPQAAEAARITRALVQSAPTVTGWNVTLHQQRGDTTTAYRFAVTLKDQRLYVRYNRTYLYSHGHWYWVTLGQSGTQRPADWQWAFAALPAHLAQHRFTLIASKIVDGRETEGIRSTLPGSHGTSTVTTSWVDQQTGLVTRLDRLVMRGSHVVERDSADYAYRRAA